MADVKGWLKQIGMFLVNEVGQVFTGGPIFSSQAGTVPTIPISADTISKIKEIVTSVQVMSNTLATPLTGEQKLAAAAPLATQVILSSFAFSGLKVQDQEAFKAGAAKIASGVVDCLNATKS